MSPLIRIALHCVGGVALLGGESVQEKAGGSEGVTLTVSVDCALGRELVWTLKEAGDDQVREVAARVVRKRLAAMGRGARVTVDHERSRLAIALEAAVDPHERELLEGMLRSLGVCELFFVADEKLVEPLGIDLAKERKKLEDWRQANPDTPLEAFNISEQGPDPRLAWVTVDPATGGGESERLGWPLLLPLSAEEHCGAASFENVHCGQDDKGSPTIRIKLRESRVREFAEFTKRHLGNRLAVVVGGQLVSAPTVESVLVANMIIKGRFEAQEARRWVESFENLRGPLRLVEIR